MTVALHIPPSCRCDVRVRRLTPAERREQAEQQRRADVIRAAARLVQMLEQRRRAREAR